MSPDQGNLEIQEALKEFELKERQMQMRSNTYKPIKKATSMTEALIKHSGGLIKKEKQAECALLVFIGLCFLASFFLFSRLRTPKPTFSPDRIQQEHIRIMYTPQ